MIGVDAVIGFEGIGSAVNFYGGIAQTIGLSAHRTAYVTRVVEIAL
jgi:hypothetical protein